MSSNILPPSEASQLWASKNESRGSSSSRNSLSGGADRGSRALVVASRLATIASLSIGSMATNGCGIETQGVDSCRTIEQTRCRAAPACPGLKILSEPDVESCVRFTRDQCLHGMAVADPGPVVVQACASKLEQLGQCARGGKATLADCDPAASSSPATTPVCDALSSPQLLAACEFLNPPPPPDGGADSSLDGAARVDGAPADAAAIDAADADAPLP